MRSLATIRTLNELTRVCRDAEGFCRTCSAWALSADFPVLLRQCSEEWGRLGDELQALVLLLGGEPATSGSTTARLFSAVLALRFAILGASDAAALEEWERMQQQALEKYEDALAGYLPERIRRTVSLQAGRIMGRYDRIGELRDQLPVHSRP